jgi:hypothetical protein
MLVKSPRVVDLGKSPKIANKTPQRYINLAQFTELEERKAKGFIKSSLEYNRKIFGGPINGYRRRNEPESDK